MGYCGWAFLNERNREYHDREWGLPVRDDDRTMFEHLSLECLQCGLSWDLMLKKREVFRRCFEDFSYERIALFGEADVRRILETEGMLRSDQKVRAVIGNARCCLRIREEFGSLCDYFWSWTGGKSIIYEGHPQGRIPVSNGLSDRIGRDLKKRGFRFVGPVTVYSHLQACGLINDHASDCPRFREIGEAFPMARMEPDLERFPAGAGMEGGSAL